MSVLKWFGLGVAMVGLLAMSVFALGSSSYSFSYGGQGSSTSCGSLLFAKQPDDALCDELRADNKTWLAYGSVVTVVGVAGFLIARRGLPERNQDHEVDLSG